MALQATVSADNNRLGVALRKHLAFSVQYAIVTASNLDSRYAGRAFRRISTKRILADVGLGESRALTNAGISDTLGNANVQLDFNLTNMLKGGAISMDASSMVAVLGLEFVAYRFRMLGQLADSGVNTAVVLDQPCTLTGGALTGAVAGTVPASGGIVANEYADLAPRIVEETFGGMVVSLLPNDVAAGCLVPLGVPIIIGGALGGVTSGDYPSISGENKINARLNLARDTVIVQPNPQNLADFKPNQFQLDLNDASFEVQPVTGTTGPAAAQITTAAGGAATAIMSLDCYMLVDYAFVVEARDANGNVVIRGKTQADEQIIRCYAAKY